MSTDSDATANVLYGTTATNTKPGIADGFASQLTPQQEAALNVLYDGNSATPPRSMLESAIDRRRGELLDAGIAAADVQQTRADFDGIASTGLPEFLVMQIADRHISHQIADARPHDDGDGAPGPSDAQVQAWNEQNLSDLRIQYGAADGEQLLARTRRWVRSQPALARVLQQHGLGSDPTVVRELVAFVFSNGIR